MIATATDLCFCDAGPQSFRDDLDARFRAMKIYNLRNHLAIFPRDLVREWWDEGGDMPEPTSRLAYIAWKRDVAPRRRLHKGPLYRSHKPRLKIIDGGKRDDVK
jgi:hypothetical protein